MIESSPISKPLSPPVLAPLSPHWSASSTKALSELGSKRALNAALKSALASTIQTAPPRFPDLQKALQTVPAPFGIDVSIVDDAEMHALNLEHRGKDKTTDVLSFALFEGETMAFPGEDLGLGDLVISIQTAARQAQELGHDLRLEMGFLAIHGALHLLGYDHVRDSDRRVMWKWQEKIWEDWKVRV